MFGQGFDSPHLHFVRRSFSEGGILIIEATFHKWFFCCHNLHGYTNKFVNAAHELVALLCACEDYFISAATHSRRCGNSRQDSRVY